VGCVGLIRGFVAITDVVEITDFRDIGTFGDGRTFGDTADLKAGRCVRSVACAGFVFARTGSERREGEGDVASGLVGDGAIGLT
jgi:hypothetical protein